MKKVACILQLTHAEREHLYRALLDDIERGDHYGNRHEYDARAIRLLRKLTDLKQTP